MKFLISIFLSLPLLADNSANLSRYAKGVFAELQGEGNQAKQLFTETLSNDPDCFPLVLKVTQYQDQPTRTKTLRDFAKTHRQHLPSQLHYTRFLNQTAPHDSLARQSAIETLEIANTNFPHNPAIFAPLINLYENDGRRSDSLKLLENQLQAEVANPDHWLALPPIIRTLHPAESPEFTTQQEIAYSRAAETGLHRPDIARTISDYHKNNGRLSQAISVLQKHLHLTPSSHPLRTRLGLLQLSNKDEAAGEQTLLDTIAIDPDQTLAHQSLAELYARRNDPLKSLHHRAQVLRIQGGQPDALVQLANEYLDLDQPHPARLLLEKARFDHPENPAIHARLAIATLRDGDSSAAARLFRQAETLAKKSRDPRAARYLDSDFQLEFANSLVAAGDLTSAETRLRQAAQGLDIDRQPEKYARAITALAKLWLDQNKNQAPAQSLLQRALSLDPDNAEAQQLLEQ